MGVRYLKDSVSDITTVYLSRCSYTLA